MHTFAICIKDEVPSCIRAPPVLHCTHIPRLFVVAYSNALVIFSPYNAIYCN